MAETLNERDWKMLIQRIENGKCTPFIGAGARLDAFPKAHEIAEQWAKESTYPLDDHSEIVRVAQYLVVTGDYNAPKEKIISRYEKVSLSDLEPKNGENGPHRILAKLPLPLYITTNYDNFMFNALKDENKDAKQEFCRWNRKLEDRPTIFDRDANLKMSVANPVVFHLHGHIGVTESMVLAEEEYLDFVVNISKEENRVPRRIQEALAGTSLIFIGYQLTDWDFRVLLRSLKSYFDKGGYRHFAVQILDNNLSEDQRQKVREYLNGYLSSLKIKIYWGNCFEFLIELKKRWEKEFKHG